MTTEHVHDWQPPESIGVGALGAQLVGGRYRPEDINMRVCSTCGELGWLV